MNRMRFTVPLLTLACACSDILDLHDGFPYPTGCESDRDCTSSDSCVAGSCRPEECEPGAQACSGQVELTCGADRTWIHKTCDTMCKFGSCEDPRSCEQIAACAGNISCCKMDRVDGGSFDMRYAYGQLSDSGRQYKQDQVQRAVRTFALDHFEVTVSRFRRFVDGYGKDRQPAPGAGAYPGLPQTGWNPDWNGDPAALPGQQAALEQQLSEFGQRFDVDRALGDLPVRGVNWYVAQAFCIWDGGRLPTEAEWAYAASGGQARDYPWPNVDGGSAIEPTRAWYGVDGPRPVGTLPEGAGRWNQLDLAGNVREWVFDAFREQPAPGPCASAQGEDAANEWACIQTDTVNGTDRVLRGGAYSDTGPLLQNVRRTSGPSEQGDETIGFRCARDLDNLQ